MHRISKKVIVVNALGIHARAAAKLSKLAQTASSNVWVTRDGQTVDASSILDILTLACAQGTTITLEIDDPADKGVLIKIEQMVAGGFGED
jgi:phosphocarrier protein